jgi:hypothetical protein
MVFGRNQALAATPVEMLEPTGLGRCRWFDD